MKKTIVTKTQYSKEFDAWQRKKEDAWSAAEIILEETLKAYQEGELGFEQLCRYANKALSIDVIVKYKNKALGEIVAKAIASAPPKRKRGNPGQPFWVRRTSAQLCKLVAEKESLPISRETSQHHGKTVFMRVADIMAFRGIAVTKNQVENWYQEYKDIDT